MLELNATAHWDYFTFVPRIQPSRGQTVNVAKSYFSQSVQLFASFSVQLFRHPFDRSSQGWLWSAQNAFQSNMDKVDALQLSVKLQYGNRNPAFLHKNLFLNRWIFYCPSQETQEVRESQVCGADMRQTHSLTGVLWVHLTELNTLSKCFSFQPYCKCSDLKKS